MKTLFSIGGLVFLCFSALAAVPTPMKISDYPNTNALGPNQLFLVTAGATNMNVRASQMPGALGVPLLTQFTSGTNDAYAYADSLSNRVVTSAGTAIASNNVLASNVWDRSSAHWWGAVPGADATRAIQNALASGRATITIPGTYLLSNTYTNPWTTTRRYCLVLSNNNQLVIGPGVTLKLADSQQTDATGPIDLIIMGDGTNIIVTGGGKICGNTAGQAGWTGGYLQTDAGNIIYRTNTAPYANTVTISDLTLYDHFSNPVNIWGASEVRLQNLVAYNCGEGFQLVYCTNATMTGCSYSDPANVCVGDGSEFAHCLNFSISRCFVGTNGNGAAFDLYCSHHGTLSDFTVDGWTGAIQLGTAADGTKATDIAICNGVIKNCTYAAAGNISLGDGDYSFSNIRVIGGTTQVGFDQGRLAGFITTNFISFNNCFFDGAAASAFYLDGYVHATITGCEISRTISGIVLASNAYASAASPLTITAVGNYVHDCSSYGILVNGSNGIFCPVGRIVANNFANNGNSPVDITFLNGAVQWTNTAGIYMELNNSSTNGLTTISRGLGVGTYYPEALMDVEGTNALLLRVTSDTAASGTNVFVVRSNKTVSVNGLLSVAEQAPPAYGEVLWANGTCYFVGPAGGNYADIILGTGGYGKINLSPVGLSFGTYYSGALHDNILVDYSGNVGIGTNAPAATLQIAGNNAQDKIFILGTTNVPNWVTVNTNGVLALKATNFIMNCTDGVGSFFVGILPDGTFTTRTNTSVP